MSDLREACCEDGAPCCGKSQGLSRRTFMKTAAAAAATPALAGFAAETIEAPWNASDAVMKSPEFEAWKAELWTKGGPLELRGKHLRHVGFPLGGIGAGQVFLSGRGALGPWQIVNNFNSNAHAQGGFFAVRAQAPGGAAQAWALQEEAIENAPGVRVAFTGVYPFADLDYEEPGLPLEVHLRAYSPFIPLNAKDSALPAALFEFTLRNPAAQTVDVSLAASAPNLVGWDGYADPADERRAEFFHNQNTFDGQAPAPRVVFGAARGKGHAFHRPLKLHTNSREIAREMRYAGNLDVYYNDPKKFEAAPGQGVYWFADIGPNPSEAALQAILDAAESGATVILSGEAASAAAFTDTVDRSGDVYFETWEKGVYEGWAIEGEGFGAAPATGTLPNQQAVSGFEGERYVNTYHGGDVSRGRATSRPFQIEKAYIHLLVGGGNHPGRTCVNLRIDGEVAATAAGKNREHLEWRTWDVGAHKGKQAVIEIVDEESGGWGHVLVDTIVFSDHPSALAVDPTLAKALRDILPFTWTGVRSVAEPCALSSRAWLVRGLHARGAKAGWRRVFDGFALKPGARVLLRGEDGVPLVVSGKHGKGAVYFVNGSPINWVRGVDRKTVTGNLVARAARIRYQRKTGWDKDDPQYGSMALAVHAPGAEVSALPQYGAFSEFWTPFAAQGRLKPGAKGPSEPGKTWRGALCARMTLAPGEEKRVRFTLAWHFPNRMAGPQYGWTPEFPASRDRLGNHYNHWFKHAGDALDYVEANYQRLAQDTHRFCETFHGGSLPHYFLDAVSANIAILRSPLYLWLEDGTVAAFEGTDSCCPMNCTHVFNYAMTTAYLFPELERRVREIDWKVQMNPTGYYIPHRTVLPLTAPRLGFEIGGPTHPALDGELGTILKTCREFQMCGDRAWLEELWPYLRQHLRYLVRTHVDPNGGVIRGEQPNTYDIHTYGTNTFIGSLYLAALRATESMATALGDSDFADEARALYARAREAYDRICWNGEYYYNAYDAPEDKPELYNSGNCWGAGCHSDQLLGQWWAVQLGLGHVLPADHVQQALRAVFKHNWLASLSGHRHYQRVFAEGAEKGLLVCTWPQGGRPERPIYYCDEVWTGIEYHVAATLIHEGLVEEGLQIVKGARERYTGVQRNPWSEIECGGFYARAMSSYSLLTAASGAQYDAARQTISIAPKITPNNFECFFAAGAAWGALSQRREQTAQRNAVSVAYGEVTLAQIDVELPETRPNERISADVTANGEAIAAALETQGARCLIRFSAPVTLAANGELELRLSWA